MKNLFPRHSLHKMIAGALLAATLQFFVPLINAAISDRCCESNKMQCCQTEFPSRLVCCAAQAKINLNDSTPTQGIAPNNQGTYDSFVTIAERPSSSAIVLVLLPGETLKYSFTINSEAADNHLYKKFSSFLI